VETDATPWHAKGVHKHTEVVTNAVSDVKRGFVARRRRTDPDPFEVIDVQTVGLNRKRNCHELLARQQINSVYDDLQPAGPSIQDLGSKVQVHIE
jgi:hypothetical protein